jgi:hypothetical protein
MKAVRTSKTSVYFNESTSAVSQKAAIFILAATRIRNVTSRSDLFNALAVDNDLCRSAVHYECRSQEKIVLSMAAIHVGLQDIPFKNQPDSNVVYYGTEMKSETFLPLVTDSPNRPHDTGFKVTLVKSKAPWA